LEANEAQKVGPMMGGEDAFEGQCEPVNFEHAGICSSCTADD